MADAPATPYIGLARKYRPQRFSDVVGQDQIAASLAQQIVGEKVGQAYIFSGSRGVGKTSSARILAKSLNCVEGPTPKPCGKCEQCMSTASGNSMDVIEIDGASNNSVDDVRDLQKTISQNPFSARKKIYIIDEVHMLSPGAFNALLKTLEEPPSFVIFILATTELEKIPETIKSRCQTFQFARISLDDIIRRLDYVAEQEEIEMDPGERHHILEAIAFAVDGGMRDALMALDQLRALGEGSVNLDDTTRFLGVVEHDQLLRTVEMLHQRDTLGLLNMIADLVDRGRDLERFVKNLLSFLRDLMIVKAGGGEGLVNLSGEKMKRARALLWEKDESGYENEVLSHAELLNFVQIFMQLEGEIKGATQVRVHLEFAFVKITTIEPVVDIANLLHNIEQGVATAPPPRPATPPAAPPTPTEAQPAKPAPAPPQVDTPDMFGKKKVKAASKQPEPKPAANPEMLTDVGALWVALVANPDLDYLPKRALKKAQCTGLADGILSIEMEEGTIAFDTLNKAEQREKVEVVLESITGERIALRVTGTPSTRPQRLVKQPQMAGAGTMNDSEPPMPTQAPSPVAEEPPVDTYTAYLKTNDNARARESIKSNPEFREKVAKVKKFFDGKCFDPSGKEIPLEA